MQTISLMMSELISRGRYIRYNQQEGTHNNAKQNHIFERHALY
jgi:hypothetical protein